MVVPCAELFEVLIVLINFGCILVVYEKKIILSSLITKGLTYCIFKKKDNLHPP